MDAKTCKEVANRDVEGVVHSLKFCLGGKLLIGTSNGAHITVATTGNALGTMKFKSHAGLVPDFDQFALKGGAGLQFFEWKWIGSIDEKTSKAWLAALRLQFGLQFQPNGRIDFLSSDQLVDECQMVRNSVAQPPQKYELWQHRIISRSQLPPGNRTASPWSTELEQFK